MGWRILTFVVNFILWIYNSLAVAGHLLDLNNSMWNYYAHRVNFSGQFDILFLFWQFSIFFSEVPLAFEDSQPADMCTQVKKINFKNSSVGTRYKSKLILTHTLRKRCWVLLLHLINYFCVSCPFHVVRVNWCTDLVNFLSLPETHLQHFSSLISTRTSHTFCGCKNLTGDKARASEAWLKKIRQIIFSEILF